MLRITKQTDYGLILLTRLAEQPEALSSAGELSGDLHVPPPMASKILKQLAAAGVLDSQRGAKGGYRLARPAKAISVAEVIAALEGPIALTECIALGPGECEQEPVCPTRANWHRINVAIERALAGISLADMASPLLEPILAGDAVVGRRPIELVS